MAAAIYNARAGLKPIVFAGSPPGGQLTLTTEVENYPGFESILGPDLVSRMRKHAEKFGVRFVDQNIVKVDFTKRPFSIYLPSSSKTEGEDKGYRSRSVIVATGAKALWLGLESEKRLRGKGVSACATCDGFFFKERTVAVVGGGDTALEEALTMTKFAKKVYLIHRRNEFRASKIMQERVFGNSKIEVIFNAEVEEILGEMKVEGLKLKVKDSEQKVGIRNIKIDGVFIAIGHKPDTDIFIDKVELDQKGYIVVKDFMTSVPGVFAAGDCIDHKYRQATTAVGMGVSAALETERWLEGNQG